MRLITGQVRRKLGLVDARNALLILVIHYAFYALYVALMLALRLVLKRGDFFPVSLWTSGFFYYPLVAPLVNAALHISYAEVGSPWLRFCMWVHTMFNAIYIAVVVLI